MAPPVSRVVVITGASAGIGAAVARKLAAEGATMVLVARREKELNQVADEARKLGASAVLTVQADVTRRDQVVGVRDRALAEFRRIDVWINNAGRGITRSVLDLTEDDVDEMIAVNLKSAIYGMQVAVPHFVERGEGHLINIASFLGRVPVASFRSVYSASKAALNSLTANLRTDLHAHPNVHVSLVMPGVVTTDFARNARGDFRPPMNAAAPGASPMKPQTPEEVAERIVDVIHSPVAEVYTNPVSAELARWYYTDIGAFERAASRAEAPAGTDAEGMKLDARV